MFECMRRLEALGYWIDTLDCKVDESMLAAIKAFRRIRGYKNSGPPNFADLSALEQASPIRLKPTQVSHFVVDIGRQLIFFVEANGRVSHILPVSTGNGRTFTEGGRTRLAITPRGRFTVYQKVYGWRDGPLGQMYYPNYVIGGVSIHGSAYVVDYPRTHGCIAVPLFAAEKLSEMMPIGTLVIIRGRSKNL